MMITVVPFWMDLSSSIFYLAAPLMVIEMGGNPIEIGLIGTITASVHMVLANLGGRLSDRVGRRILQPCFYRIRADRGAHQHAVRAMPRERQLQPDDRGVRRLPHDGLQQHHQPGA